MKHRYILSITHFFHSTKLSYPLSLANERTLSNDPSADSTYSLLALKHPVPLPSFYDQFCKLTYFLNNTMKISSISTIKANLKK